MIRLEDNYLEIEAGALTGELEIVATPNCAQLPAGTACATHEGARAFAGAAAACLSCRSVLLSRVV